MSTKNRVRNPRAELDGNGAAAAYGTGGAGTLTRTTGLTGPLAGVTTGWTQAFTTAPTAAGGVYINVGSATVGNTYNVPVVAGDRLSASAFVRSNRTGQTFQVAIYFYDSAGAFKGSALGAVTAQTVGQWQRLTVEGATVPAGAVTANVLVFAQALAPTTAETIVHTGFMLVPAATLPTSTTFFDGSITDAPPVRYTWTGAVGQSSSVRTTDSVAAAADPTNGRMTLSVEGEPGTTFYIFRRDSAGTVPVRDTSEGSVTLDAQTGQATVQDYEPRQGATTDYLFTDPNGATLATTRVTIPAWGTWIKSPGRPFLNVKTHLNDVQPVKRDAARALIDVEGSTYPVAIAQARKAQAGSLVLACRDTTEAGAVEDVLADGGVVMIDTDPSWGVDFRYVSVGDVTTDRVWHESGLDIGRRLIALGDVQEVLPPLGVSQVSAAWTYAQVPTQWATYAAITATVATYNDLATGG